MHRGYIKLWRRSEDSAVFKNDKLWKLWTWCLMRAAHKTHPVEVQTGRGNTVVTVEPGQFIFGRRAASKAVGGTPSGTWKRMLKLKTLGNLDMQSNSHYSLVSIVNWELYQGEHAKGDRQGDNQVTSKEPASNQQGDTNKNVFKNDEHGDHVQTTPPTPPPRSRDTNLYGELQRVKLTSDEHAKLLAKHGHRKLDIAIDVLDAYIASKNKRYANHYAVLKEGSWVWDRVAERLRNSNDPKARYSYTGG